MQHYLAAFGVRLVNPVDEFNAARHVGADSPSVNPPGPERMEEFFDFLKERIAGALRCAVADVSLKGKTNEGVDAVGAPDPELIRLPDAERQFREAIAVQETRPLLPLIGKFPAGKQRALVVEVMKAVGFPFDRGRLDESEHPFTEGSPGDIRITTHFDPDDVFSGLLGALHETGHAMYDLGLPQDWRDQPVGRDRGMALVVVTHDIQSAFSVGDRIAFLDHPFPLDDAGRTRFRSRFREVFEGDPSKVALYKDVSNGVAPGGIEYYLPLFFEQTATVGRKIINKAIEAARAREARRPSAP